ncbi:MAG: putative selenate reductase subunit YgfK, partial [Spirochaetales bacterium]
GSFSTARCGKNLETPLGAAAGPHTQLCRNIISAWLCGARFIELKTVHVLDKLTLPRPCIDMEDEGYNCEWSQELSLEESFEQYADAWVLLHVLKARLFGPVKSGSAAGTSAGRGPGFIFNMSVGYNLEGIKSDTMRLFVSRMRDASGSLPGKIEKVKRYFPEAEGIHIPSEISGSVTLSTMHGCPSEEIEKIGRYLLEEAGLHTTIKLNPTLLGPSILRGILNDGLGYKIEVPDGAFGHDLVWEDAVGIITRLKRLAGEKGLSFGVKLSNTLECVNNRRVFPGSEKMMYLSGRALFPLTAALAVKLAETFEGGLDISYAGGADCFNFPDLVRAGVWPVTVCSDLLRPGGYTRFPQYLENLKSAMKAGEGTAGNIVCVNTFSVKNDKAPDCCSPDLLAAIARRASSEDLGRKDFYESRNIKNSRKLGEFDCVKAPCVEACPVGQDVPGYLKSLSRGSFDEALAVIRRDNPLASICGMVCEHPCEAACTRLNYDEALAIRDLKRSAVARGREPETEAASAKGPAAGKAAVIGAGPAGLACARELALYGVSVTVFEKAARAGGMAERVIPGYRIREEDIGRDVSVLVRLGVEFRLHTNLTGSGAKDLLTMGYDCLFIAAGAPEDKRLQVPGTAPDGPAGRMILGGLEFLEKAKFEGMDLSGKTVAVTGGGNSAMDAARTALKLVSPGGSVIVLYRRKREHMPADREERKAVIREGIEIRELVQPVSVAAGLKDLEIRCIAMKLGEEDETGRPRPVPAPGPGFSIRADLLISALGQERDVAFISALGTALPGAGVRSGDPRIFFGGDLVRGPSNIVQAAADGKQAAGAMLAFLGVEVKESVVSSGKPDLDGWFTLSGRRTRRLEPPVLPPGSTGMKDLILGDYRPADAVREAGRCLDCGNLCNVCVSVCPNRANIFYETGGRRFPVFTLKPGEEGVSVDPAGYFEVRQGIQTANITDFCNQCGNCVTFCPSAGSPFLDKPRFCLTRETFSEEDRAYHICPGGSIEYREGGSTSSLTAEAGLLRYVSETYRAEFDPETLEIRGVSILQKVTAAKTVTTARVAAMAFLLDTFKSAYFLTDR